MAIGGHWSKCYHCDCDMWLPPALYEAAQAGKPKISFFCSYGHEQVFAKGESKLDQMRRERDRLAQQVAQKDDEIAYQKRMRAMLDKSLSATRGQVTKLKKRASAGTCPCCNRTFQNMAAHMKTKHPNYLAEETTGEA